MSYWDEIEITPEDRKKMDEIRRHVADLAVEDLKVGKPYFWDNDGMAMKQMVSIKKDISFKQTAISLIHLAREHGYTDGRWGNIIALKNEHIYKRDDGIEVDVWATTEGVPVLDANGNQVYDQNGHPKEKEVKLPHPRVKVMRYYNGSAINGIGLEPKQYYNYAEKNEIERRLLANKEVKIVFDQNENNFYNKDTDTIHMIPREKWKNKESFLVELYHCAAHAALHNKRQGRNWYFSDLKKRCGLTDYAVEEYLAEMATYRFRMEYGLKIDESHKKAHSEYLERWASEVKNNPNFLYDTHLRCYTIMQEIDNKIIKLTNSEKAMLKMRFNNSIKKKRMEKAVNENEARTREDAVRIRSNAVKNNSGQTRTTKTPGKVSTATKNTDKSLPIMALEAIVDQSQGSLPRWNKNSDLQCTVYHPEYGKGNLIVNRQKPDQVTVKWDAPAAAKAKGALEIYPFDNNKNQIAVTQKNDKWFYAEAAAIAAVYYEAKKQNSDVVSVEKLLEDFHGTHTYHCEIYHTKYGKGRSGDIDRGPDGKGVPKTYIDFGQGAKGTGDYSQAQEKAQAKYFYYGDMAKVAEVYYEAEKQKKAEAEKAKLVAAAKSRTDKVQESEIPKKDIKVQIGQIVDSKRSGRLYIEKIYTDENNIEQVKLKRSPGDIMTITARMDELKNPEYYTVTNEYRKGMKAQAQETQQLSEIRGHKIENNQDLTLNQTRTTRTSSTFPDETPVTPTTAAHTSEIVIQTPEKEDKTVHEHREATMQVVQEIQEGPRKHYNRRVTEQEKNIVDNVVTNLRNMPAGDKVEYGRKIEAIGVEMSQKQQNVEAVVAPAVKPHKKTRIINNTRTDNTQQEDRERYRALGR